MYITHWLIVGWGVGIVGFQRLGLAPVLVAMGIVVVLTSLLTMAVPVIAGRAGLRPIRPAATVPGTGLAASDAEA